MYRSCIFFLQTWLYHYLQDSRRTNLFIHTSHKKMLVQEENVAVLTLPLFIGLFFMAFIPNRHNLSVPSHNVFQLWDFNYLVDFKAKFLIEFLCILVEVEDCQRNTFNIVILKNEIYKPF